ncbi:MAG: FMN-binding protein [Clostridiales bacterium]|nr:FMN-binding protein [Clostridiales bacterium]
MVLLVAGHIALFAADFASYKKSISAIEIAGMDADRLKDGVYEGEYDAGYIYAKVSVVVENGRIRDIKILEHDHERGKAAEAIIERIIEQQSTRVDAVTGATNSSLVIMKAIENALGKGK